MQELQTFFTNTIYSIGWNDALDIAITTFVLYKILEFIKETRAQQLIKGLAVLVIAYFLSGILNLHVVHWFLGGAFTIGLFALVVLFQPELRRGLEYMGRSKFFHARLVSQVDKDKAKFICDEIADAAMSFSASKTGALIVFEREITLEDIAETGTLINAEISEELLGNLFYEGSPLHDGAVIIRGDKVYAAGCVLPLTDNKNLNKSLGTRHRAGIGITENSDALTLIVSEETGIISIAQEGKITRFLDKKSVEKILFNLFITEEEDKKMSRLGRLGNRLGRGKHASK
ncbi:TIGR00159 family protein [Hornefia porci]|uniref:Diadenylate cyclase n=1 Tax=Hornefia porci TaxID=2652292 RepID=A0A1Q9JKN7_9FIRM|nr:diadenylate cyclase CdaA [Hornefia porci]OLR56782.1 TIGR00159 family protein [Hornefia porci]